MRPVDKGTAPKKYKSYGDAQPDLIAAIGRFCSYCGRFIASAIHVEHKRPKRHYPSEELEWSNLLLSCGNCNSSKGYPRLRLSDYLWPDTDNTLRALEYLPGGIVRRRRHLTKRLRRKVENTIRLLGLDRHPGGYRRPTNRDLRWEDRRSEWDKAVLFRRGLQERDTPRQRELAVAAAANGVFTIWWQVFEGDIDMRRRLRGVFVGTAAGCFDADECVVARAGGQV